jgi:hypothetical protein
MHEVTIDIVCIGFFFPTDRQDFAFRPYLVGFSREIYIFTIRTIATRPNIILRMILTNLIDKRSFNIGFAIFAHRTHHASLTRWRPSQPGHVKSPSYPCLAPLSPFLTVGSHSSCQCQLGLVR